MVTYGQKIAVGGSAFGIWVLLLISMIFSLVWVQNVDNDIVNSCRNDPPESLNITGMNATTAFDLAQERTAQIAFSAHLKQNKSMILVGGWFAFGVVVVQVFSYARGFYLVNCSQMEWAKDLSVRVFLAWIPAAANFVLVPIVLISFASIIIMASKEQAQIFELGDCGKNNKDYFDATKTYWSDPLGSASILALANYFLFAVFTIVMHGIMPKDGKGANTDSRVTQRLLSPLTRR